MLLFLSGFILGGGIQSVCSNRRSVRDVSPEQAKTPPAGLNGARIEEPEKIGKGIGQLFRKLQWLIKRHDATTLPAPS